MIHNIAAMVRALNDVELCRLVWPEILRRMNAPDEPYVPTTILGGNVEVKSPAVMRGLDADQGAAAQATLRAIRIGMRRVMRIAAVTGYSRKTIENALTRLKKRGRVSNSKGVWVEVVA